MTLSDGTWTELSHPRIWENSPKVTTRASLIFRRPLNGSRALVVLGRYFRVLGMLTEIVPGIGEFSNWFLGKSLLKPANLRCGRKPSVLRLNP